MLPSWLLWLCPVDFKTLSPDRSCMTCVFRTWVPDLDWSKSYNFPYILAAYSKAVIVVIASKQITDSHKPMQWISSRLLFTFCPFEKSWYIGMVLGNLMSLTITRVRIANHMQSYIIASIQKFTVEVKSKSNLLAVDKWTLETFTRNADLQLILIHCICSWVSAIYFEGITTITALQYSARMHRKLYDLDRFKTGTY